MKRQTAIYIGIAIIVIVGAIVLATNKPSTSAGTESASPTIGSSAAADAAKTYTLADVQAHNTPSSCWATINGSVYDLTNWINKHPGGPDKIINLCGKDGTVPFNRQHGGQARPEAMLATFKIGTLNNNQ